MPLSLKQASQPTHDLIDRLCRTLCQVVISAFLPFGLVWALLLPPFEAPDEGAHWQTGLANRERLLALPASGCSRPRALTKLFPTRIDGPMTLGQFRVAASDQINSLCTNGHTYGFIMAYPAVLAAAAVTNGGNQSGSGAVLEYYLSRLFGGFLVFASLWRLGCHLRIGVGTYPIGILTLLTLTLSPYFLQQSFSVTADIPSNALALTLVSLLLFYDRQTWVDLALVAGLGYFACVSKAVLFPVILPICALAAHRSPLRSALRRHPALWIGAGLTCLGIWVMAAQAGTEQTVSKTAEQLAYMKDSPLTVFVILLRSLWPWLRPDTFMSVLGWFDIAPSAYMVSWFTALVLTAATLESISFVCRLVNALAFSKNRPPLPPSRPLRCLGLSAVAVASIIGSCLLILTFLYATWTPVKYSTVEGIQGRYFFAALFLLFAIAIHLVQQLRLDRSFSGTPVVMAPAHAGGTVAIKLIAGLGLTCYLLSIAYTLAIRFY